MGILTVLLCISWAKAQVTEPSDSLKQVYKSSDALFYTFNYPSKSATGEDVILSSLLVAWMPKAPATTDSIESLHIYSHYTITANKDCPTSDQNAQDRLLFGMLVKGNYGMGLNAGQNFISHGVLIAPDYEGYGVSKDRSHPYLAQELTARQVMDAVEYGLALYQKHINDKRALDFKSDWRSFSWGFSQGGAVALAVHRYIEENDLSDRLRFRGSICGDGPYDLPATMQYYMEDNGNSYDAQTSHRSGMCTLPMVMPMIVKGALDTHPAMKGHTLEDFFSQQFLDTGIMNWLASKSYTTGDISKLWYNQLQNGLYANGRRYTSAQMAELFYSPSKNEVWGKLDKMFTPGFKNFAGKWQDLYQAMADNSLAAGWKPQHRIQFVHSRGDMVVPFSNYLSFRDAHAEDEDEWFRLDDSLTPQDHMAAGTNFFIALLATGAYGEYFQWLDASPATGIQSVEMSVEDEGAAWYDLSGRRLNGRPTARGIYVVGGRKIAIK